MSNLNLYKSKVALNELDTLFTKKLELSSEFNYQEAYELLSELLSHQSKIRKPWLYANPPHVEDDNWAYAVTLNSMRSTHVELLEKTALFLEKHKPCTLNENTQSQNNDRESTSFLTGARELVYEFTNFIRIEERLLIPLANKLRHYQY